jgi:heterodisulfide reductase subunit C
MESLRQLATTKKSAPAEREIDLFHRLFLQIIRRWGRIYEAGLAVGHNLWSRHLFANVALLPAMLSRGKLAFLPPRTKKGATEVRAIFRRVAEAKIDKGESAE